MIGCDYMKIEKVNDNQIRCTLTKADLADRQIKLSELAYGTEKAKSLFRDMMQQAAREFGFEAEDIPLMIEAIPLSADCIILIITKVEDPEELDTRFSKFAPSIDDGDMESLESNSPQLEGADDVLGLFKKIHEEKTKAEMKRRDKFVPLPEALSPETKKNNTDSKEEEENLNASLNLTKLYIFQNLDNVGRLANILNHYYSGENSLYKNSQTGSYYLVVSKTDHTPEEFNKICNILSEYGDQQKYTLATEAYFNEHLDSIVSKRALQILSKI